MDLYFPPPELVHAGQRALKTIAMADGSLDDKERGFLEAVQHMFRTPINIDALEPIEPDELAALVISPELRRQLVRGMTVMVAMDGEVRPEETRMLARLSAALDVHADEVRTFQELSEGRMMHVRFDVARRFWARERAVEMAKDKGIGWLVSSLSTLAGLRTDTAIASRYRALRECPAGSLGRGYFDFIRGNGFSFPGEKGSPPEFITLHDLTHVLSGYGTDPAGELQVLSFHAGCRREQDDPFGFILFGLAQFQLGVRLSPIADGFTGKIDPDLVLKALVRGKACEVDPTKGWDPWPEMDTPLDELRARVGIPPLSDFDGW